VYRGGIGNQLDVEIRKQYESGRVRRDGVGVDEGNGATTGVVVVSTTNVGAWWFGNAAEEWSVVGGVQGTDFTSGEYLETFIGGIPADYFD